MKRPVSSAAAAVRLLAHGEFESFGESVWWAAQTVTTVGYGDVIPTTTEGRIAAGILMILGIGLYSAITATVTSYLISTNHSADLADQLERLATLHADGRLNDDEYLRAKSTLIGPSAEVPAT